MEPIGALPCTQEPAIGPYPEADQPNLNPPTQFPLGLHVLHEQSIYSLVQRYNWFRNPKIHHPDHKALLSESTPSQFIQFTSISLRYILMLVFNFCLGFLPNHEVIFLPLPVSLLALGINNLVKTLFSNSLNLYSSLTVGDNAMILQDSYVKSIITRKF
jgi:hypothetical protein